MFTAFSVLLRPQLPKTSRSEQPRVGVGVDPRDTANPWAVFGNYVDRVVIQCVNDLTPKWSGTLAGFDVFIGINATRWSKATGVIFSAGAVVPGGSKQSAESVAAGPS